MEDKLRRYVDDLFSGTVPTKKSVELKEEMIQNLNDKYNDLLSEGKTQEAAYNIAVAGIGDVSALIKELENEAPAPDTMALEAARRRSAMFTAISVMMYILSFVPMLFLEIIGFKNVEAVGMPLFFLLVASATGLLVYNNMTKPRFNRASSTIVEEFREWQDDTHRRKSLRRSISAALWSVVLASYLIISFVTWAWPVTWIIFILGGMAEAFINLFFALRK